MRAKNYGTLSLVVLAVLLPALASATSIVLTSISGGTYNYGVTVAPGETVLFGAGQTITFTNLAGVTGGSTSNTLGTFFSVSSFTPSSVTFITSSGGGLQNTSNFAVTFGYLTINSTVTTPGDVNYSMQTQNQGTVNGVTQGPAALRPEPSTLALFGMGLAGIAGLIHKRVAISSKSASQ